MYLVLAERGLYLVGIRFAVEAKYSHLLTAPVYTLPCVSHIHYSVGRTIPNPSGGKSGPPG